MNTNYSFCYSYKSEKMLQCYYKYVIFKIYIQ
jgi:hypothetical protein